MTATTPPGLAEIFDLAGVPVMALMAAHRHGLVASALQRAATPEEFAQELDLDPSAVRLVLNVLAASGAVVHRDGTYEASSELADRARKSPGGVTLHLDLLSHMPDMLATGDPLLAMDGNLEERGRHYSRVAQGLGTMYPTAAAELAEVLSGGAVLDLGAGSGVWSLAIAARRPGAHITAVDLPPVLAGLHRNAAGLGVADRVTTIAGSYFDADVPVAAFDVVILGNVLHLETPPDAEKLVAKAAAALRPGGCLVVIDILGAGPYEPDAMRSMYALFLALRTRHGRMHARSDVEGWLSAATLCDAESIDLPSAPTYFTCVRATRRKGNL